jgi:hypothetical protein
MNKKELKGIIKPLIKECLTEILVEEGLMKIVKENVVKESMQATPKRQPIVENKPMIRKLQQESVINKQEAIQEVKKKLASPAFDPFAGTDVLKEDKEAMQSQQGVDISSLLESNVESWNEQLRILENRK